MTDADNRELGVGKKADFLATQISENSKFRKVARW